MGVIVADIVVLVIAFLRFGLEVISSAWPSVVEGFMRCCKVVLDALVLPPCRYCSSLPLKLVILLTGTSSAGSRASSSGSVLVWTFVARGILFAFRRLEMIVLVATVSSRFPRSPEIFHSIDIRLKAAASKMNMGRSGVLLSG